MVAHYLPASFDLPVYYIDHLAAQGRLQLLGVRIGFLQEVVGALREGCENVFDELVVDGVLLDLAGGQHVVERLEVELFKPAAQRGAQHIVGELLFERRLAIGNRVHNVVHRLGGVH